MRTVVRQCITGESVLLDADIARELGDKKLRISAGGYVRFAKQCYLHRHIMNPQKGEIIDHINGNPLDNRRCNLRRTDRSNNGANRFSLKANRTGFSGVSEQTDRNKRWYVRVHQKQALYDERFYSLVIAALFYDRTRRQLWTYTGRENFPTTVNGHDTLALLNWFYRTDGHWFTVVMSKKSNGHLRPMTARFTEGRFIPHKTGNLVGPNRSLIVQVGEKAYRSLCLDRLIALHYQGCWTRVDYSKKGTR